MSLEKYLRELAQGSRPLKHVGLVRLSGLVPEEVDQFRREWAASFDPEAKQEVLTRLVETAEDNVEVDFNAVFRCCLDDTDSVVREKAVSGLWECDDRQLVQPLIKLLQEDPAEEVRAAAAMVLGKFAALAETGKILSRDGLRIEEALLGVIENHGEPVEVRRRAIEAIALFNSPRVRQLILEAFESDDPRLRRSAVYAMGRSGFPQWLETILQQLQSDDSAMRYEAANACGELGEVEAVPYLASLTQDDDVQVQLAAVHALRAIGGRMARRVLLGCAKSSDEVLREAAQEALQDVDVEEDPIGFRFEP